MKLLHILLAALLIAFPFVMVTVSTGGLVHADDDLVEETDDTEATIEEESAGGDEDGGTDTVTAPSATDSETEEGEEEEVKLKPSPDADTTIHFITPSDPNNLPAGKSVRLLVGFMNKGRNEFTVDNMDAAFHYPQDYSYYIQNFTTINYMRVVEPNREATFEYGFTPSEVFGSRPFVLTINLNYRDAEGNAFSDAVFNNTINIVEYDEGLDGETFFLYVFLAAVVALIAFAAYHFLTSFGKKRLMSSKPRSHPVETGTQNNKNNVDYDWLPKEHMDALNKSPGRSPKTSPRLRSAAAAKRRSGAADD